MTVTAYYTFVIAYYSCQPERTDYTLSRLPIIVREFPFCLHFLPPPVLQLVPASSCPRAADMKVKRTLQVTPTPWGFPSAQQHTGKTEIASSDPDWSLIAINTTESLRKRMQPE
jgi:hypothetical protein